MKIIFKSISAIFLFCLFGASSVNAADIIGTWVYEVSDTPPEYAQGEITISLDGEAYKAEIKTAGGMMNLDKIQVDGNTISFNVMVDGSDVKVTMTFDGDSMTGKAESYDGIFTMRGKRKEN